MTIANAKRSPTQLDHLTCTIEHQSVRYPDVKWANLRYCFDLNIFLYLDDVTTADDLVYARLTRNSMRKLGTNHGFDYSDYLKTYFPCNGHFFLSLPQLISQRSLRIQPPALPR